MKNTLILVVATTVMILCSSVPVLHASVSQIKTEGARSPHGSPVAKSYSVMYVNNEIGEVTHVEYVDADGRRSVSISDSGEMSPGYNAYETFLHHDNTPRISPGQSNSLVVTLEAPAAIEIRNGETGELLASFPSTEIESTEIETTEYIIPADVLSHQVGKLIVVDVVRSSDKSYRGTASIPYGL